MTSVFSRLFKYRPREKRLPEEDFFTEVLAGVLQKTPDVRTKFVEWLIGHDGCEVEIKEADIDTQKSVHGGRLDIYVGARSADGQRHVVGVENKISAKEGGRQIERYLKCLGGKCQDIVNRNKCQDIVNKALSFSVNPVNGIH